MSRLVDRVRHQFSNAHLAKRAGMVLLALGGFSVVGTSASAYWTTQGAGTASASTGTLNAAAAPVASMTGPGTVHLTWTGSTLSNGAPAQGYYVTRSSGSTTNCGTPVAPLPIAATSCDDVGVADGTYTYGVTAVYAGWTAPSGSSNSVTVVNDSTPPTVTINQAVAQNDPTNNGTVVFTATFSEPVTGFATSDVTVSGTAGGSRSAAISGSGPNYTVTVSGATGNGTIMATIGASTVQDLAGNNNTASTSTDNTVTLDTIAPTVTGVGSTLADGSYKSGQVVPVRVTFSEPVIVTGIPQLTLGTGTPATTPVNYTSGSGTSVLTFSYTVAAGNTSPDLDYAATTSLALNGGTIRDLATNSATLTLPAPAAAGSLGASKALVIDTTAPAAPTAPALTAASDSGSSSADRITNVTTPTFTGSAEAGATVTLYDGVTPIGTAVATGGAYSVTSIALTAGVKTMAVRARDVAGNVGASSTSTSITIDLTAPSLAISSCTGGSGKRNTVAGTTDVNGTSVSVNIFTGNGTGGPLFAMLTATPSAGSWSATTTNGELTQGARYTAQATQIDTAGNTSNQPTCSFVAN